MLASRIILAITAASLAMLGADRVEAHPVPAFIPAARCPPAISSPEGPITTSATTYALSTSTTPSFSTEPTAASAASLTTPSAPSSTTTDTQITINPSAGIQLGSNTASIVVGEKPFGTRY